MFHSILRIALVLAVIATAWMHTDVANANIVRDGLLSAWTFDRETIDEAGEDPIIKDVVGPFDGKVKHFRRDLGDQIKIVEGKFGEALMLGNPITNGPVSVDLGRDIQKEMQRNFTFEGWFKFPQLPGDPPKSVFNFFSNRPGRSAGMLFQYREQADAGGPKHIVEFLLESPLGICMVTAPFKLQGPQLKQWFHFAATYDESSTANIYINGELKTDTVFINGAQEPGPECKLKEVGESRQSLKIGFSQDHPYRSFIGPVDEVRVYKRALTPKEVQKNFTDKVGLGVRPTRKLAVTWGQIKVSN